MPNRINSSPPTSTHTLCVNPFYLLLPSTYLMKNAESHSRQYKSCSAAKENEFYRSVSFQLLHSKRSVICSGDKVHCLFWSSTWQCVVIKSLFSLSLYCICTFNAALRLKKAQMFSVFIVVCLMLFKSKIKSKSMTCI